MAGLDDILKIPGNRPVYQSLRDLLNARQAIAFAGAGVSAPLYPLWPGLLKSLAQAPVDKGLATDSDVEFWLRTADKRPLQVASQIHQKLTDAHYYPFLYETFKDRPPFFTPAHDALIRCNFKAWITTNYDQGLVEARRVRRPEIRETSFAIWNQPAEIERWLSGDRFGPDSGPILFAHGHFADAPNIVLDLDSYRRAYATAAFRRFYEDLWIKEHLIFAGFSFNDVTLTAIADEMVGRFTYAGPPRHVAILALSDPYNDNMRREYLETFHAEVLFYPAPANDHGALVVLLESLAGPARAPLLVTPPPVPAAKVRQGFIHETTEDEKFTGRLDMLERLDAWAADPIVRLIAISALGGLGKTALLGKWLRSGAHRRQGVFFWSFYRERDTTRMLEALTEFAQPGDTLAIALDGLEVIQESPGTTGYGKLLDPMLAELLHRHCRARDGNLVLLTSRFPFPDLTPYLGRGLRSLPLASLGDGEGAALLETLGVGGRVEDRSQVSHQLDGHPLALRIFARSMPPECGGDPTRLWILIFDHGDHTLEEKVRHLLEFYERRLPEAHRQVLGLLALFRAPVGVKTLDPLWEKLMRAPAPLGPTLDILHREHLLTDDPSPEGERRYACHPILRDHFRRRMMGTEGFARDAASLLGEAPDATKARSLETVMPVITAIELLLECGDLKAAHDLYQSRLGNVFKWIPAPHWGMEVARWFVRDEDRRQRLEKQLGVAYLRFYLASVGLWAAIAGEPEMAVPHYASAEAINRRAGDRADLLIVLRNIAEVETSLGRLGDAIRHATEALEHAVQAKDDGQTRTSHTQLAFAVSLRGDVDTAAKAFAEANAIENRIDREGDDLYSIRGIYWAEHLVRTGQTSPARKLTARNREICEQESWQDKVACCEWLLAWLDVVENDSNSAHRHLDQAEATFTRGHMIQELAHVHLTRAACHFSEDHLDPALAACERALDLAAPRNYRLIHADGLVLRARIALARDDATAARNDAESALQIAEPCEYAWAERDACEVLAQAWRTLDNPAESARYADRAANLNRRLTP